MINMRQFLLPSLAFTIAFSVQSFAATVTEDIAGDVFKKDTSRKEKLFQFKNTIITDDQNKSVSEAFFLDLEGKPVVKEVSERKGSKLIKYELEHLQTQRKGSIVVENGKINFNYEEEGKKKPMATEPLTENFVVGHTLLPYVSEHWKELQEGKTVEIRIGVWERQETVGFSLFKVGQEKLNDRDVVLLKFKPTSFIIAALVDPIIFKFSTDGKDLLSMVGRILPKMNAGPNKWKDLDAEVLYKITKK